MISIIIIIRRHRRLRHGEQVILTFEYKPTFYLIRQGRSISPNKCSYYCCWDDKDKKRSYVLDHSKQRIFVKSLMAITEATTMSTWPQRPFRRRRLNH